MSVQVGDCVQVLTSDRPLQGVVTSLESYSRITVPLFVWVKFDDREPGLFDARALKVVAHV